MLRLLIFWIGAITTAVLAVAALVTTLGWGKATYDKRKQDRADKQAPTTNKRPA